MSQSGKLVFFSTQRPANLQERLAELFSIAGCTEATYVYRTLKTDREWAHFLRGRESVPQGDVFVEEVEDDQVLVGERVPFHRIAALFVKGKTLRIQIGSCSLAEIVKNAIEGSIPESIRGSFLPCEMSIGLGYHDIFEHAEHEEGFYFGRAFISIQFFGYGTPQNWRIFRKMLWRLRRIVEIKAKIKIILGKIQKCVYWDI